MAIFPLAWLILKVSWPIWVATYHQLGPSFGHLRSNFAGIFNQMTPCTRRNAPKAPKILSAFNLPRFSIPLELPFQCSLFVQCHSVRSNSLREQVPFPQASLSKIFKPPRVFFLRTKPHSKNSRLTSAVHHDDDCTGLLKNKQAQATLIKIV